MARVHVAVGLAVGVLLAAGCGSARPTAPESGTAEAGASATPVESASSTAATGTQHVVAGPVGLDIPAGWHVREGSLNPSGNVTYAFLSPDTIPADCSSTAQGGVCHPWPVSPFVPGGIVVAVRQYGMPGSVPPSGGDPITVAGLPANTIREPADDACRAIGGSELIRVVLPAVPGTTGWVAIDACIAAADAATAEGAFRSILESTAVVVDAVSP